MGSHRTVSFSPDEMIALGKEMLEWLENNPDTLHLSEWYTIEKMFLYNEWKTFIQREEFIPYYEKALKIIGIHYLNKDSKVRDGISQRWQRVYFKDLKELEDQDKDDDVKRKQEENKSAPNHELLKLENENIYLRNENRILKNDSKS